MKGKPRVIKKKVEGAVCYEPTEKIYLQDSIFGDKYIEELKEINKHEIVVKIAEILGACPSNLHKAEEIFERIKYILTNYIIHHEYNSKEGVSAELLIWLDSRINPGNAKKLSEFISKYI